jgi:hypothetical protein
MPDLNYINKKNGEKKKRPRASKALRNGTWGVKGQRKRGNGTGGMW